LMTQNLTYQWKSPQFRRMHREARLDGFAEGLEKGREEGSEKGIEKGIEEGIEKGREKGREEGREEGRDEGLARSVSLILQARGLAVSSTIARRIARTRDAEQLAELVRRAAVVERASALFPRSPRRR
ncbi:MAG: Yae1 family protein, partial [Polyangiaceae bacterium]|nr:Yae1 family protein [Polyangiaceae bacterium]